MNRLQAKVSIVTGGSLGIGQAVATRMAEEGAKIAILDVLSEEGKALEKAQSSRGLVAKYWQCEVANETQGANIFNAVADTFGSIDVVVNNAGVSSDNQIDNQAFEKGRRLLRNSLFPAADLSLLPMRR